MRTVVRNPVTRYYVGMDTTGARRNGGDPRLRPLEDDRIVIDLEYSRLSDDPQGKRANHTTQKRENNDRRHREGWPPIPPGNRYSDNDRSASDPTVERPGWTSLLNRMKAVNRRTHKVRLIAASGDRFTRRGMAEAEALADLIEAKFGELWSASSGHYNTGPGTARIPFLIEAMMNHVEAVKIGSRAYGGMVTAAMEGRPHSQAGYGWDRIYPDVGVGRPKGMNVINEHEADVIRGMAKRLVEGGSLTMIARELNERGEPAPGAGKVIKRDRDTKEPLRYASGQWDPKKIRQLLLRKANVGIRKHQAADSAEDGGLVNEYKAQWEPILDEKTYAKVIAILAGNRRTSTSNLARHLLSHIAVCFCGNVVTAQPVKKKGSHTPWASYRCYPHSHVQKSERQTDKVVEDYLLDWVSIPEVRALLARKKDDTTTALIEQAKGLRDYIVGLEAQLNKRDGSLNPDQFGRLNKQAQAELAAIEAAVKRATVYDVGSELLEADDVYAAWPPIPLDRKRAIIAAWLTVTLHPTSRRGRNAFDPETVVIEPKVPLLS